MTSKSHWENVYTKSSAKRVGWYRQHLQTSLEMIAATGAGLEARVIDIGGGAATLVDDLLGYGYERITVLDWSGAALSLTRSRLGNLASKVQWIEGDVKNVELPPDHYDIWHDRAVFHFLTDAADRRKYMDKLQRSLSGDGHVVIATFAPEAPPKCSGLNVQRYTPELLQIELGENFALEAQKPELHVTPGGVKQMYWYCRFRRLASPQ